MITAVSITGGETYLSKHLKANDYYAEGEKVEGEWIGKGAKALGLDGAVEAEHFEALRNNLHPFTGERLTARSQPSGTPLLLHQRVADLVPGWLMRQPRALESCWRQDGRSTFRRKMVSKRKRRRGHRPRPRCAVIRRVRSATS